VPDNNVIALAARFRAELERHDALALGRIADAYGVMVNRLVDLIDALTLDIEMGGYSVNKIRMLDRYLKLMSQAQQELNGFAGYLGVELQTVSRLSIDMATKHAQQLILTSAKELGISAVLGETLNTDAIVSLLGFLGTDSPLYARLLHYGEVGAERISAILLEGVGLGYGADKLKRMIINEALGVGLTDAMRIIRTSQVYAYREASRANYIQHSNIVRGWVWHSALIPGRTCMSCVRMHGTEHPLSETLNDHHNGLCTPIPLVGANPVTEGGDAWFDNQSEATQKQMLGVGKYDAWKDGKISISDMSKTVPNDVYGDMRTEAPLKDLI